MHSWYCNWSNVERWELDAYHSLAARHLCHRARVPYRCARRNRIEGVFRYTHICGDVASLRWYRIDSLNQDLVACKTTSPGKEYLYKFTKCQPLDQSNPRLTFGFTLSKRFDGHCQARAGPVFLGRASHAGGGDSGAGQGHKARRVPYEIPETPGMGGRSLPLFF